MIHHADPLTSAARAIVDRVPVNWSDAEESAADPSVRDALRELKIVEEIAAVHRAGVGVPERDSWGPLRLLEHIAHGSFGDVYRALDTRLDREVALKLLRRPDDAAGAVGASAIEEARLLARVRHPNVVTIHGADRVGGRVGLWMEFVHGRTLEQIVHDRGPLTADEVAAIGADVCAALEAVHTAGLLHRDIKAQNVMREDAGRLVLMDFGAGRETLAGGSDLTGTPLYLAPEVLEGGAASVQSDLYSVGVLLFHLATGRYPVEGRSVAAIREQHAGERTLSIRAAAPAMPARLAAVIARALARSPAARFPSAAVMSEACRAAVAAPRRWSPAIAAWAVAVMAALTGAGAWLRGRPEPPAHAGVQTRLLWDDAIDLWGTVSADGRYFSFPDWDTGNLAVRDLVEGRNIIVTSTGYAAGGEAESSAMSPDGTRVAYVWVTFPPDGSPPTASSRAELRVIGIDGRGERVLLTGDDIRYVEVQPWSGDGQWIAAVVQRSGRDGGTIELFSPDGARHRTALDRDMVPRDVRLSPDGSWLAFSLDAPAAGNQDRDIYLAAVTASAAPTLVAQAARLLSWTADGASLLINRPRGEASQLSLLPVAGGRVAGEAVSIESVTDAGTPLGVTHAGALVYGTGRQTTDVLMLTLDSATGRLGDPQPGQPVAAYGLGGMAGGMRFAPRGGLAFSTPAQGTIVIRSPDGATRTIVPQLEVVGRIEWAADGRSLIVGGSRSATERGFYRVDLVTGAAQLLFRHAQTFLHTLAPDGKTIYYRRPRGPLVARDLETGSERVLMELGSNVFDLRVSRDGTRLAVVSLPTLFVYDLRRNTAAERYTHADADGSKFFGGDWSADDRYFVAAVSRGHRNTGGEVWSIPMDGGEPLRHPMARHVRGISVSGDGRQIATVQWKNGLQVWQVENFLPRPAAPGVPVRPVVKGDRAVWKGLEVDLFGTVSDDGRYLTYVDWEVTNNLMIRDLAAGTSRALTKNTTFGEFGLAFYSVISKDGRRVVYQWRPAGAATGEVHLMDLAGGAAGPSRVLWKVAGQTMQPYDWSADGRQVLARIARPQTRDHAIALVDVRTGGVRIVKVARQLRTDKMLLSPDGRFIAYDSSEFRGPQRIAVLAADGSGETVVVDGPGTNTLMGWARTGHVLFASDRTGKLALWAVIVKEGRPVGAPRIVKDDIGSSWSLGLTSSGTLHVFKASGATTVRLSTFDLARGVMSESAADPVQYIDSRGRPDWSADGRHLSFITCGRTGGHPCRLFVRSADSGIVREVPHQMAFLWYPRLSPDGRRIVTVGNLPPLGRRVAIIDVETGATTPIVDGNGVWVRSVEWAADGTRIYLGRSDQEVHTLFERDLTTGAERPVYRSTLPGVEAVRISPGGRTVAFVTTSGPSGDAVLMVAPIGGGAPRPLFTARVPQYIHVQTDWVDEKGLLVTKARGAIAADEIWYVPLSGPARRLTLDTSKWIEGGHIQLQPGGQLLSYVASAGDAGSEVWALENFLPADAHSAVH